MNTAEVANSAHAHHSETNKKLPFQTANVGHLMNDNLVFQK